MAQKMDVHLTWSCREEGWMLGNSHYEGGDLEPHYNLESHYNIDYNLDPSLVNVVKWDDRERGEGPGDAYWSELADAECCIKEALPYLSRDKKISFLDEAVSHFRAVIREWETERAKARWQRLAFFVKVVGPALRESLERMRSIKPGGQAFETAKDSFNTGALKMAGMETGGEGTDKLVPSLNKRARDEFERDFIDDGDGDGNAPVSEAAEQCAVSP